MTPLNSKTPQSDLNYARDVVESISTPEFEQAFERLDAEFSAETNDTSVIGAPIERQDLISSDEVRDIADEVQHAQIEKASQLRNYGMRLESLRNNY